MDYDFSSFLVGMFAGLVLAYIIIHQIGRMIFQRLEAAVAAKDAETESNNVPIQMKVEQYGNVIYAFRKDNNDFVCQGTDLEELKKNFVARFPGKNGSIVDPDEVLRKSLLSQKKESNENRSSIGPTS